MMPRLAQLSAVLAAALLLASATSCTPGSPISVGHEQPRDLEEAMRALDRRLDPATIAALRSGELEPVALHHGVGTGIRNEWGLWSGSPLAQWFQQRGIQHPDDMSSIILTSYTRRLRGESIGLDEQIANYREYWAQAEARRIVEIEARRIRMERVEADRMGWRRVEHEASNVAVPERTRETLEVAKIEPHARGLLVFERPPYNNAHRTWPGTVHVLTDLDAGLQPFRHDGCESLHDALSVGATTALLCRNQGDWVLFEGNGAPTRLPLASEQLRLGSHGPELLLVDPHAVHRRQQGRWQVILSRDEPWFPQDASTPRVLGSSLYFSELALMGWALRRVDLERPNEPIEDGYHVLIEPYIGRRLIMPSLALVPSATGGLWISGGDPVAASLFHVDLEDIGVAVFDGQLDGSRENAELRRQVPAAVVVDRGNLLYLAGPSGIATSRGGQIELLVRLHHGRRGPDDTFHGLQPSLAVLDGPTGASFVLGMPHLFAVRPVSEDQYEAVALR